MSSRFVNGLATVGRGVGIVQTVLITLSALALLIAGIVFIVRKDNTRAVPAIVTQVHSCKVSEHVKANRIGTQFTCSLTVRYVVDGKSYAARVTHVAGWRTAIGDTLQLRVSNSDPYKVESRPSYDTTGGVLLGVAGVTCLSALSAFAMTLWARRSRSVAAFMGADAVLDVLF